MTDRRIDTRQTDGQIVCNNTSACTACLQFYRTGKKESGILSRSHHKSISASDNIYHFLLLACTVCTFFYIFFNFCSELIQCTNGKNKKYTPSSLINVHCVAYSYITYLHVGLTELELINKSTVSDYCSL